MRENLAFTERVINLVEGPDRRNANPPPAVLHDYLRKVGRIGVHVGSELMVIKHIDGQWRIAVSLIDASLAAIAAVDASEGADA